MYSNIPIDEGFQAFKDVLDTRSMHEKNKIPINFLMKLLESILKANIFEFNGGFWQITDGNSNGHSCCANICQYIH